MSARGVGLVLGRAEEVEEKLKKSRREWLRGKKRWETDEEGEGRKDKPVVISADDGVIRSVVY